MDDINRAAGSSQTQGQNQNASQMTGAASPLPASGKDRPGSALAIWLLMLGIVVGAVGMWAFDSFYRIPNKVSEQVASEIAQVKAEIVAENSAQQLSLTGRIAEIDEDNFILILNVGQDMVEGEGGEEYMVARELSFSYDENTVFKIKNSDSGEFEDSSLEKLPAGKSVTIKSDRPITNYLLKYYAKEVTSF